MTGSASVKQYLIVDDNGKQFAQSTSGNRRSPILLGRDS
jgi:hypothetical protein